MDDHAQRDAAARDPALYLENLGRSVLIVEAQYCPNLFPELKRLVDDVKRREREGLQAPPLRIWLTGSHRVLLDTAVSESLTGRASYYRMHTLSISEQSQMPEPYSMEDWLFRGGWPELATKRELDPLRYLNDHIDTTLVKDIILAAGIHKTGEFVRFLRLLAGRTGQLFSASEIARDAGVQSGTISEWLGFVERMMYITTLPPFTESRTTRLIKAPKIFFLDAAIAVRLQGWTESAPLQASPAVGALFETLVLQEIVKIRDAHALSWEISHFRTKEGQEIDFIVSAGNKRLAIEAKLASSAAAQYRRPQGKAVPGELDYVVVSWRGGPDAPDAKHLALAKLGDHLLSYFSFPTF